MSNDNEELIVIVTEGPIAGYEPPETIVVFKGQTEINDECVDITFGVDHRMAHDIVLALNTPVTDRVRDEREDEWVTMVDMGQTLYAMVCIEPWQIIQPHGMAVAEFLHGVRLNDG
jgi:hypothetical protein